MRFLEKRLTNGSEIKVLHEIEGIFIQHGKIEFRIKKIISGEESYYNVGGVDLPGSVKKEIMDLVKPQLKQHRVHKETIRHPQKTDKNGEVTEEEWMEDIYDKPFKDMIDC